MLMLTDVCLRTAATVLHAVHGQLACIFQLQSWTLIQQGLLSSEKEEEEGKALGRNLAELRRCFRSPVSIDPASLHPSLHRTPTCPHK